NLLVFVFSTIDSPFSGVFLYFTGTAAAAIILFARHHRYIGHIFVLISIALGLLAHTTEWSPIPNPPANDAYVQVSFITNYTIGILACVLIVHFSISRNNEAEASLMASIKAREQAEQTLILKNEELEKANKELDRFVYSASHDMRAPLSSLLGLMEIIRLTNKNSELNEYLGLMKKRILTMEGFIKEITDYSRNTRMTVSAEKVNFYNLVKGVIESIEFVAPRDAVEARVNIPEDMMVECDVARMKVILNNLISNCLKYQDSDKEARYYSISAKMKENELTMVVEDNGIGIEENYQKKVFDMFFRATELSDGSGLGLYIVKETVEKLKGEIQVASTPGVGSTFTVTIPLLIESPA
ncbi:MAG: HAMP domain-containing sensor histidine kinase, partial [Cyclobacteriaceae bacterium]